MFLPWPDPDGTDASNWESNSVSAPDTEESLEFADAVADRAVDKAAGAVAHRAAGAGRSGVDELESLDQLTALVALHLHRAASTGIGNARLAERIGVEVSLALADVIRSNDKGRLRPCGAGDHSGPLLRRTNPAHESSRSGWSRPGFAESMTRIEPSGRAMSVASVEYRECLFRT